jgi:hypothetical protein
MNCRLLGEKARRRNNPWSSVKRFRSIRLVIHETIPELRSAPGECNVTNDGLRPMELS